MTTVAEDRAEIDSAEQDAFLEKIRNLFSKSGQQRWVDYVAADEEAMQDKTARLRAERLRQVMQ